MTTSGRLHLIFVDFENVPEVDLRRLIGRQVKVTLLIGLNQPNAAKKLVETLADIPFEVRLLKIGVVKKNALDFALAFHLGECAARYPEGRFYIVSADKKDFDPLVTHLRSHHVEAWRSDDIGSLPFLTVGQPAIAPTSVTKAPAAGRPPKISPKLPPRVKTPAAAPLGLSRVEKIIARLNNPASRNRPSTEKKLRASIQNEIKKAPAGLTIDDVLSELQQRHVLAIEPNGKVTYVAKAVSQE
jgi:hypothetical protein